MLDPNFIRQNPEKVKDNTANRNKKPELVTEWLALDEKRNELIKKIDTLRAERNELSKGISGKPSQDVIEKVKAVKEELEKLESDLKTVEIDWDDRIKSIPNMIRDDVPLGKSDADNIEREIVGEKPQFDFEPKDHLTLMNDLGMIDFEAGAKVSGSQFYYMKGDGVLLEYALIQYGIHKFIEKGFELFSTPDLAKSRYYLGTGYAPKGDEAQTYEIEGEDLGLIATAEVTMAGYHADEILEEKDLPKKYIAISHCYRKEAGAYGKFSKGLYRVHQFTKLEMFAYATPENSDAIHMEMLEIEKEIVSELGLPFRILQQCTGDLGSSSARTFDVEAWMPGRGDYGEITSTSNCTDYQSRNLNIRYKDKDGNNNYVHMLNGTAIVMSRFPVAIVENYQQADGSIRVPEVLQQYMGKKVITKK